MVNNKLLFSSKLAFASAVLALVVVMLGAYTRLKEGGLGCPDWPGCYGHAVVPSVQTLLAENNEQAKIQPLEAPKAWAEMVHRYFAGGLSLAITILFVLALLSQRDLKKWIILPALLFCLLIFQAILGMWTVTWLLYPLVVMAHLVGGMSIMALLWIYGLYTHFTSKYDFASACHPERSEGSLTPSSLEQQRSLALLRMTKNEMTSIKQYRVWALLGLLMVVIQIILGGWTSSNYAALACPDFPLCQGKWLPDLSLKEAFLDPLHFGPNYQGGLLSMVARVTIQFLHRAWAFIILFYLTGFVFYLFRSCNRTLIRFSYALLSILLLQFALGVLNVFLQLPLVIAVLHNGVAALLLLVIATLNYYLILSPRAVVSGMTAYAAG